MTAEQHLAEAERLLNSADQVLDREWAPADSAMLLLAIGHGLAAVAVELGVPHASSDSYGAGHVR